MQPYTPSNVLILCTIDTDNVTAEKLDYKKDLIEACKQQDRAAQSELYHNYCDAMYNIAYRMLGNEHEAEDVLQVSFVDVFRSIHRFSYQATPGAWIKKIVVNNSISALRKRKTSLIYMEQTPEVPQLDNTDSHSTYDISKIRSAILSLADGYRTILSLYLIEGYDHTEIADIMGITTATSKSQYSRAKKRLRAILSKEPLSVILITRNGSEVLSY